MRERITIVYTKSIHHFYVAVDRQECTTFRSFNDQLTGVIIVSMKPMLNWKLVHTKLILNIFGYRIIVVLTK